MTTVSLPMPGVGLPLPGRGCDCRSCAFWAGPDGRGGPATVEPLCSGSNSDCSYYGCAATEAGSPRSACSGCPIRCGSRTDIAQWMADVGGTLTFDDIVIDGELPDLPAFVPMTDGSAVTQLDASLRWPAYGVGLRRVFSPDTHTIYPRFAGNQARDALALRDGQKAVLVGYGEDPLVEAFWTYRKRDGLVEGALERRAYPVQTVVSQHRGHDLETDWQPVVGQPAGHRHRGTAVQVGRNRAQIRQVHLERIVHPLTQLECRGRRSRRHEDVDLLEGRLEVALDESADLLRLAVVRVVVAGRQRVGAKDDATLHLGAESGLARRGHDCFGGSLAVVADAQSVSHRVITGEVARGFARRDQVVGGERIVEVRAGHLDHLGAKGGEGRDGLVEARADAGLVAVTGELLHNPDPHAGHITAARCLDHMRHGRVDRCGVARVMATDHLMQESGIEHRTGARSGLVQ